VSLTPEQCDTELPKPDFDALARQGAFADGPYAEDTAKTYGAPYVARKHYRVFGKLHDGRKVWAWRYPEEREGGGAWAKTDV
jgi:hypothetical protein